MKHKLSNRKVALPLIALALVTALPLTIAAQAPSEDLESTASISAATDYVVVDTGQEICTAAQKSPAPPRVNPSTGRMPSPLGSFRK